MKAMEMTKVDVNVMKPDEIKKLAASFHQQEEGKPRVSGLQLISSADGPSIAMRRLTQRETRRDSREEQEGFGQ